MPQPDKLTGDQARQLLLARDPEEYEKAYNAYARKVADDSEQQHKHSDDATKTPVTRSGD